METISGLYKDFSSADRGVHRLQQAGFKSDAISVLARNEVVEHNIDSETIEVKDVGEGAAKGAAAGGVTGGLIGLLAAVGSLVIPGIGPAVAAGSLAATLGLTTGGGAVGAAIGGILGAMTSLDVAEEDAQVFAEGVRRGGILVIVQAPESQEENAKTILKETGAMDVNNLRSELEEGSWNRRTSDLDETS